jgi:hypothetical protein
MKINFFLRMGWNHQTMNWKNFPSDQLIFMDKMRTEHPYFTLSVENQGKKQKQALRQSRRVGYIHEVNIFHGPTSESSLEN